MGDKGLKREKASWAIRLYSFYSEYNLVLKLPLSHIYFIKHYG